MNRMAKAKKDSYKKLIRIAVVLAVLAVIFGAGHIWLSGLYTNERSQAEAARDERNADLTRQHQQAMAEYQAALRSTETIESWPTPTGMGVEVIDVSAFPLTSSRSYTFSRGELLSGELAQELAGFEEITVLCGHYEGIDQRALDALDVREVSIGDYVLTGGELPAMVLIDTVARFLDGVLSSEESVMDESVYSGLLEYPQYSKPREYEGMDVPDVLLSGNHKEIKRWRWEQSLELTAERRPDMMQKYLDQPHELTRKEREILEKYRNQ